MINVIRLQSIKVWQQKRLLLDIFLLLVICLPFAFYLASTISLPGALTMDGLWYLNRVQLLGEPYFDDPLTILYMVMYSLTIRLVSLVVGDIIFAAILVNVLSLFMVVLGTYVLGRVSYNRLVAWFASTLVLTNAYFDRIIHIKFTPYVFMTAVLVWILIAFWLFVMRHNVWSAIFLGVMLSIGIYTRLEFLLYCGLLLPAVYGVYRISQSRRRAIIQGLIAGGILLVPALVFVGMLLGNVQGADAGSTNLPPLLLLQNWPVSALIYSGRVADSILNTIGHAPWWAWLGCLVAIIWPTKEERTKNLIFALIIPFNMFYIFVLSGWPWETYLTHGLPVVGLLCGTTLVRIMNRWSFGRMVYVLAIVLLLIPGGHSIRSIARSNAPLLEYRNDPIIQDGLLMDQWLFEHGYADTEIFTFCGRGIPSGQAKYHYLFRQGLQSQSADSNTWWNSPEQLFPYMQQTGKLFMACDDQEIFFRDWHDYFEQEKAYDYRLEEVGRVNQYIFYEAVANVD